VRAAGAWTIGGPVDRRHVRGPSFHADGYRLVVAPDRVVIEARHPAGEFYAGTTLAQLVRLHSAEGRIPAMTIEDWPDFAERGVMLDVSRDKVPTMETLLGLVEMLASWKINRLQLYFEHTFAYRGHEDVWKDASPFDGSQVEQLDAFCRERFIELVPNQNSFGHMERWLKLPRYAPLAEVAQPEGDYMSLCPIDPRSIALLAGLYDDLLPRFRSRTINVGCDETIDLGRGRSAEAVARLGVGRVYLDFLKKIHALIESRGHRMQFWGDIVLQHPELIGELPRPIEALEWGYEADHPFAADGEKFAAAGVEYHVCPGTSTWLSLAGRTDNALANLESAARSGLAHGAKGMLVTDWGDHGHWQPLPASFLPLAYGASVAWCHEANRDLDAASAVDAHAFRDAAGVLGGLARDLGNVYRETGALAKNASVLALLLLFPARSMKEGRFAAITPEGLDRAEARVGEILDTLGAAKLDRPDADLLASEFALAGDLMRHACRFGRARLAAPDNRAEAIDPQMRRALAADMERIVAEYRRVWRLRNREGGLRESAGRLEALRRLYAG